MITQYIVEGIIILITGITLYSVKSLNIRLKKIEQRVEENTSDIRIIKSEKKGTAKTYNLKLDKLIEGLELKIDNRFLSFENRLIINGQMKPSNEEEKDGR